MKRLAIFLLFASLLSSCAYKSIIIAPWYKKNVYAGKQDVLQNSTPKGEAGILNSSISLDQLLNQSGGNANSGGSYFCFLSNEEIFIYATNIRETQDSIVVLEGYI